MPKLLVPTYFTFRVMCLKESLYYYGSIVNLSTDTAESYHSILKFHSLTTNNKDIYQQLISRELNSKSIIDIYQHSTNEYKYLLSLLNYEKYIYAKTKSIWIPNEYWKYINTKLPKYCYNYIKVNSIKENKENQQLIKQYKSINDQIITAYLQYYNINITKLNTDKIYFVNKFMQLNDKHEYIYNDMFVENKNSLEILQIQNIFCYFVNNKWYCWIIGVIYTELKRELLLQVCQQTANIQLIPTELVNIYKSYYHYCNFNQCKLNGNNINHNFNNNTYILFK